MLEACLLPGARVTVRSIVLLAQRTMTLQHGMDLIGTVYNFCTPHASLRAAGVTTPAMAAGITDHCWSVRELLSSHVPPPRWSPPSNAGVPRMCANASWRAGVETTVSCGATLVGGGRISMLRRAVAGVPDIQDAPRERPIMYSFVAPQ